MIRATQPSGTTASETVAAAPSATPLASVENGGRKTPRRSKGSHAVQGGSSEANRQAIVILEVLAGVKTPTQAAADLGTSLPRYYQLETRALEGLVQSLEPRPQGKQPSPAGQIAALERELAEARRACARQQALARVAQRTLEVKLAPRPKAKPASAPPAGKSPEGGRRKRRPTVRALKAVQALRKNLRPPEDATVQPAAPPEAVALPPEPLPLGV